MGEATGVLLVGGMSRRFGSVKALAPLGRETLSERGWRALGEAFEHRIAVGKDADQLGLPFPPEALLSLADACADAAVPESGPLPGAYAKSALPVLEARLEAGELALYEALPELDVRTVDLDEELLANVNTERDLNRLRALK